MVTITVRFDVPLEPEAAFAVLMDEMISSLRRMGMRFEPGPSGRIIEGTAVVAKVSSWKPGERVLLEWHIEGWGTPAATQVELYLAPEERGTQVTLEHRGWGALFGNDREMVGWLADQLISSMLRATAPQALGDWLTDRRARRPWGEQSRGIYRDPLYHYPNFRVILAELALEASDYLLEVGCGGGALLRDALKSGCRAAAVDHSPDMVSLALEVNREAVADGRLELMEASAESLPFADATFTCAAMTAVLGFLRNPVAVFAEIRRVLAPGGRFVCLGSDPELKGTPAAPEPMASRLTFYDDQQLAELARRAGFGAVRVIRRNLEEHARAVGVPEEHLALFSSRAGGARFLLARRV